ncbi:MAG: hypothetical protein ACJ73S_29700 [Mycobacteriales bacterium]
MWGRVRIVGFALALVALPTVTAGCDPAPRHAAPTRPEHRPTAPPIPSAIPTSQVAEQWTMVQALWWNWVARAAAGHSPVTDPDGRYCAVGQPGNQLWFLANAAAASHGVVRRTCTVPTSNWILFPLVNLASVDRASCTAFLTGTQGAATVDGKDVPVATARPDTAFPVAGVAGNDVTHTTAAVQRYGCGLWARLDPLPPGNHTVTIRAHAAGQAVSVDYSLRVR